MIPEAAVEAAAIAWAGPREWYAHSDEWRDDRREDAKSALEAAAPSMMAKALNDTADEFENLPSRQGAPVAPWDRATAVAWLRERALASASPVLQTVESSK